MNLENKIVVITGASRGLGRALAQEFSNKGVNLVLAARSKEQFQESKAITVITDVTKEEDIKNLAKKALEKFGRIDVWINNAGARIKRAPIEEVDTKGFHDLIEVNLFGTFYGSREALKQMKKQKEGIIMNMLSTSALKGKPNSSAYGSSKMAAIAFTKVLRNEVKDNNIKVIGIFPGGMKTDFHNVQKPSKFDTFLSPEYVAKKVVSNLEEENPLEELIIKK